MTEVVILGLAWLGKWDPAISWEDSYRKLKLGLCPLPPPCLTKGKATTKLAGAVWNKKAATTAEPPPGSPEIPKEYQGLATAFSEEECNLLPPPPPIAPLTAP